MRCGRACTTWRRRRNPWHGYMDNVLAELVGTGPFDLGDADDSRVPDRGYHRGLPSAVWVATAAVVVEVVSPDDETWAKFDFYARHQVDEICTADPLAGQVRWFGRAGPAYEETGASGLLDVTVADLVRRIQWPD